MRFCVLARPSSFSLSAGRMPRLRLARSGAKLIWDDRQKVAYAFWENDGINEFLFLEDARSFQAKADLVPKYGLRGYSVWVLGPEDPKTWDAVPARVAGR